MNQKINQILCVFIVLFLFLIPVFIVISDEISINLYTLLRISALTGFISLALAAVLNLNKKMVKRLLGKPFLKVHHYFAFTGLILITLHPILYAVLAQSLSVFIPVFSSAHEFLEYGGRVSFILIYIAFIAGLLRSALKRRWKLIHILMYPALIIAAFHANFIGQTMQSAPVVAIINGLTLLVVATLFMSAFRYIREPNSL